MIFWSCNYKSLFSEKSGDFVARYRGGGKSEMTSTESSIDSLDVENNIDRTSSQEREAGGTETIPCHAAPSDIVNSINHEKSFQWTLGNWGASQSQPNNSGTIRVDLASPEDISLDTDNSSRVVFNVFGTTV